MKSFKEYIAEGRVPATRQKYTYGEAHAASKEAGGDFHHGILMSYHTDPDSGRHYWHDRTGNKMYRAAEADPRWDKVHSMETVKARTGNAELVRHDEHHVLNNHTGEIFRIKS